MITKKCTKCGQVKPITEYYPNKTCKDGTVSTCKKCKNAYDKHRSMTWGRDKRLKNQKDYKQRVRLATIKAYGGKCTCCGETEVNFLQIDHINGGGRRHRKSIKKDLYKVLRDLGYPKDEYRLLCANCNFARGMYGACPHEKER